jgi:hypothetical protein
LCATTPTARITAKSASSNRHESSRAHDHPLLPGDRADWWFAQGDTRAIAERTYLAAIAQEKKRPPLYRIICQFKVDQHEAYAPQSAKIH